MLHGIQPHHMIGLEKERTTKSNLYSDFNQKKIKKIKKNQGYTLFAWCI